MESLLKEPAWRQVLYIIVPGGLLVSVLVSLTGIAVSTPDSEEGRLFDAFVFLVAVVFSGALIDVIGGIFEAQVLDRLYPHARERVWRRALRRNRTSPFRLEINAARKRATWDRMLWSVWHRYLKLVPGDAVLWQYYNAKLVQYQTSIRIGLTTAFVAPLYFIHSFFPSFWGGHPHLILSPFAIGLIFMSVAISTLLGDSQQKCGMLHSYRIDLCQIAARERRRLSRVAEAAGATYEST